MSEAVQHLKYSLQNSLKSLLLEHHNPKQSRQPKQSLPEPIGLNPLPNDLKRKIADYLSARDILSLANAYSIFYKEGQKSSFDYYLLVQKKRLLEWKNCQYFNQTASNFLVMNNNVYAWGENEFGQLGLGDDKNRDELTEVNLNLALGDKVKKVIPSHKHTIFLTERGHCFGCGKNNYGQLALSNNGNILSPTEINLDLAEGDKIKDVLVEEYELPEFIYIIYLTEQGRCFVCGNGWAIKTNRPIEIDLNLLELTEGHKIQQIICSVDGRKIEFLTEYGITLIYHYDDLSLCPDKVAFINSGLLGKDQLIKSILSDLSQLVSFALETTDYGINFKEILFKRAQIAPYEWLHNAFLSQLSNCATAVQQEHLIFVLKTLMKIYASLSAQESAAYQILTKEGFVSCLHQLNSGDITNIENFSEPGISIKQYEQETLNARKIAAGIVLEGLKNATEEHGFAFTLRSLIAVARSSQRLIM